MHGRRLVGTAIAAGIGLAALAGCSTSDSGVRTDSMSAGGEAAAAAPGQAPNQGAQEKQISQPGVDRKLIRTATLELTAENVVNVTNQARAIAADLGGFAGKEDVRGDSATITLHIPSTQFDKALDRLSGIVPDGVRARSQTAEDVTEQMVDVESRINTQKASVARVRDLLGKASSVGEIVQIEGEVTRREADLESLEKRRESLSGQVALSTVTVSVSKGAPAPGPAKDDDGFLGGLAGGWHAFLTTGGVLLRVLGAVLPFLVALGVPAAFAMRWWRRRRPALPVARETGP